MKLPDIYGDWRIMAGIVLLLLGSVNWIIGLERTREYSRIIADAAAAPIPNNAYRSFDELEPDNAVLEPFTAEQRRVSYATARMDYYHATFLTGEALMSIGLLSMLAGFITIIQRDARRAIRRVRIQSASRGS
ncbi:MAG: hypothetical protein IVW54_21360 [Candidatus Binataceae bacterium]|nr:hypothetical protein [Candidatus Binataceae bacterium]